MARPEDVLLEWLRPRIGKLLFALLVVVAIIGTLTVLIASSC